MNDMKMSRMRIFLLLILFTVVVCSGFYYISGPNISDKSVKAPDSNAAVKADGKEETKSADTGQKKIVAKNFKTKEDIRKEYGKLEVVYLYSGKRYEGAVISIGEVYTMVTVNGTVRIPMKDVRARDIIR